MRRKKHCKDVSDVRKRVAFRKSDSRVRVSVQREGTLAKLHAKTSWESNESLPAQNASVVTKNHQ